MAKQSIVVIKDFIASEIKLDNFAPASILNKYAMSDIVSALDTLLDEKQVEHARTSLKTLSDTEADNLYALISSMVNSVVNERETSGTPKKTMKPFFSGALVSQINHLQAA